jgi:hypothetical protein
MIRGSKATMDDSHMTTEDTAMTQETEQIGALIYLPNADYPYPFPV